MNIESVVQQVTRATRLSVRIYMSWRNGDYGNHVL